MKKIVIGALVAGVMACADSTISLIYKNVDMSKIGLEKNTALYGLDWSFDKDIGESEGFYLTWGFQLLVGNSDIEGDSKNITYAEYNVALGTKYKMNENFSVYLLPRIGYSGYSDSWRGRSGTDGAVAEGELGLNYDTGHLHLNVFAASGKRWISGFDYTSNSYGLMVGWRF